MKALFDAQANSMPPSGAGSIAQTGIELMVERKYLAGANFKRKPVRFVPVTL